MVRQASCDVCDRNDKSSPDTAWQILGWRNRLLSWTHTSAQTPGPAPPSKERHSKLHGRATAKTAHRQLPPSFWNPSEMQRQDPAGDLDQERSEAAPATWKTALSRSSNPPMLPKNHPGTLSSQAASVYPSAKGTRPQPKQPTPAGSRTVLSRHQNHGQAPDVQQDILHFINGCCVVRGHTQELCFLRLPPISFFFLGGCFSPVLFANTVLLLRNYLHIARRAKTKQPSK